LKAPAALVNVSGGAGRRTPVRLTSTRCEDRTLGSGSGRRPRGRSSSQVTRPTSRRDKGSRRRREPARHCLGDRISFDRTDTTPGPQPLPGPRADLREGTRAP